MTSATNLNGKLHVKLISKLSRGGGYGAIGGFVGFVIGGATGYFIGKGANDSGSNRSSSDDNPEIKGVLIGGGLGWLLGLSSEHWSGREVIRLDKKSYEDKLATMRTVLTKEGRLINADKRQWNDIVYLKNGSIVWGSVIELFPDSTLRISNADGSLFVFAMKEVSRIEKGIAPPPTQLPLWCTRILVLRTGIALPRYALGTIPAQVDRTQATLRANNQHRFSSLVLAMRSGQGSF